MISSQELFDLFSVAMKWWIDLSNDNLALFAKKYLGTSNHKTVSQFEIILCYLYYQEENASPTLDKIP